MPKNHAKAIKGMSIACIVLSGLTILASILMISLLGFLDTIMQDAYYDSYYGAYDLSDYYDSIFGAYGLGIVELDGTHGMHHGASAYGYYDSYGYYDDYAAYKLAALVANVMLVCAIIGAALTLAASIIALKNHNKPEKFGLVFGWSIAGAVLGFLSAGIVQCVLFIIIAVFINSDKKLYRAGMYYAPVAGAMPGYAGQVPGQPVVPVAPVSPSVPAPGQPMQVAQPATAPAPVPVPQPQPAQPATPATAQVTTAEVAQPLVQPSLAPGETQPAAPVEGAQAEAETIFVEGAVSEAAVTASAAEPTTPVVLDEGAVIKLNVSGDEPSEPTEPSQQ